VSSVVRDLRLAAAGAAARVERRPVHPCARYWRQRFHLRRRLSVLLHPLRFAIRTGSRCCGPRTARRTATSGGSLLPDFTSGSGAGTFEFRALSSVNLDVALTGGDRPPRRSSMLVTGNSFGARCPDRSRPLRRPRATPLRRQPRGDQLPAMAIAVWRQPGRHRRSVMADHQPSTIVGVMPPDSFRTTWTSGLRGAGGPGCQAGVRSTG
jgi:hypothetical protein